MKVGDLIRVLPRSYDRPRDYGGQLGVIIAYARNDRWGALAAVDVILMDGTKECFKTLRLEVVNESG
tara:strand:+ start:4594 stop:4794 length:201 start_codon:yes stop_codon:yes gene_type:complete